MFASFHLVVVVCSGRLIRTFADVKYGNHHLTKVEIIYNIISFIIAIMIIAVFTAYAKRTLSELQQAERNGGESPTTYSNAKLEMEPLPLEKPMHRNLRL